MTRSLRFSLAVMLCLPAACGSKDPVVAPKDLIPPTRVVDLLAEPVTTTSIRISWSAPGDGDPPVKVREYDVRFSGISITAGSFDLSAIPTETIEPAEPGSRQELTIAGLEPERTYFAALRSRDAAGNVAPMSNVASARTLAGADAIPPASIADLTISGTTGTTATLEWSASGDDSLSGIAAEFDIRYGTSPIAETNWDAATPVQDEPEPLKPPASQSLRVTGLPPGTTLYFNIRALDEAGNRSALATTVSAATVPVETWRIHADGLGDAPTIQAGIDSAGVEDLVLVEPGTYFENLDFKGKSITVESRLGPGRTTIDGSHSPAPVVRFRTGETRNAILSGFTITGGFGATVPPETHLPDGGGIYILEASPAILNNRIVGNGLLGASESERTRRGGGIFCINTSTFVTDPLIQGNVIEDNRAYLNGGGIAVLGAVIPEILGNSFRNNRTSIGSGGALWLQVTESGALIRENVIVENEAAYQGGGIYLQYSGSGVMEADIFLNVIGFNRANQIGTFAGSAGGGVWIHGTRAELFRNTIAGNRGNGPDSHQGGGIVCSGAGSPLLARNIIARTVTGAGVVCRAGSTPVFVDNLAWENGGGDAAGPCGTGFLRIGNLFEDPMFCFFGPEDFSLDARSPALHHPNGVIGAYSIAGCWP